MRDAILLTVSSVVLGLVAVAMLFVVVVLAKVGRMVTRPTVETLVLPQFGPEPMQPEFGLDAMLISAVAERLGELELDADARDSLCDDIVGMAIAYGDGRVTRAQNPD